MRVLFRGKDGPEAREVVGILVEALCTGAYCDLATREEHTPEVEAAVKRSREDRESNL